ncbi:hypothetical protein [Phorcysia thermohydrogeniphila]|nr:hypothetical protein [Phorcysia thermohydrogeniphila]
MQNLESNVEKLMERIANLEKRIAVWTGSILAAIYLVDHLLRLIK